jgi:bifunctional DNA-binding transcriptional regulator/antitoxin component of YhaV-PrlF toxin-antitoxin module
VSSKGQIVLPAETRQQDDIEVGQEFEVERLDRGEDRLVRRETPSNEGVVQHLTADAQHLRDLVGRFRLAGRPAASGSRLTGPIPSRGPARGGGPGWGLAISESRPAPR